MIDIFTVTSQLDQHRQEFPGLANKGYFNFGGQGTMPRAALKAIIDTYKYIDREGTFSLRVNAHIQQRIGLLRKAIADELGVPPETITLTENVTAGCNIALWGIDWQADDHILITDCEHPGIIAIVQEIARRFRVEISTCPILATLNEGEPAAVIAEYLRPNTKLAILSHLLWNTGQVLPLAEIVTLCHHYSHSDRPIRVLVDAAQSVGTLPLNLTELGVDFYAFTGHKWWCGPAGVGGLYIRPEAFNDLQPTFVGWRSVNTDATGQIKSWKENGERFEVATSAYPLYEGLGAAIATHQQWGTSAERYQQICQLSECLWQSLSQIEEIHCLQKSPPASGLISFQMTGQLSPETLVQLLEKQGFLLRTIGHPRCVRACVHYFTLSREIEQLVEAIKSLVSP
jgi:L-cysteine/cystine lyase